MIISKKHKFVFVHNPKCAGHSIREALLEYHDSEIRYWDHEYNPVLDRIVDKAHLWVKDIALYEQLDLERFFVFGFVRNPYDRFKSAFNQYRFMNPEYKELDINDFSKNHINELSIRYDWNLIHFCPQYLFFHRGNKRLVDYIGKIERFNEDLTFISTIIGFHIKRIKTNTSQFEKKSQQKLTSNTLRIINSLYEKDFVLFDYPMIDPGDDRAEEKLESYRSRVERVFPSVANTVLSLDNDYQLLKAENGKNKEQLKNIESELQKTRSELQSLQAEFDRKKSEFQDLLSESHENQARLQSTRSELEAVHSELESLYQSRSWRYMAPLRKMFSIFK